MTSEESTETQIEPAVSMEEAATPEAAQRPEDMEVSERANLARFLTEEQQKKMVRKCLDRYDRDVSSRAPRMKRLKELQEIYAMVTKQKSFPFHKCANIRTPAVTAPVLQIQSRLFDMIWPATGKVFSVIAGSTEDLKWAHATESFANSYVRYSIPYMAMSLADTIHQKCLYGSAFRRTSWDAFTRKITSDRISIDDFVVPFARRSSDPSMADVPRYTMVHHLGLDEVKDLGAEGVFINTELLKAGDKADGASDFAASTQKIDGVTQGEDDDDEERKVLEQHCRWKLPDAPHLHPAFDGKNHHVYIVLDAAKEKLLRVCLREEDDPDDKRRFDRDMSKFQQYQMQLMTYQSAAAAQSMTMAGPMGVQPMPQLPAPPQPVREPMPIRRRQVCMFTHYRCFQGEGFYGLGYGDMLYGLAEAMNTILNQHLDGVTLKNAKPLFMSRQVRMQRGSVNVQPGEVIEVDGPINQIKDAIMWLDPPGNDPTTVPLVKILDAMKDSMAGNADLMSGQSPGSNQTKAGMQILSEQMMMPISVLARQTREEFKHELDKIWRCFGVFLEDDEISEFLNVETNQPQQLRLGRWMFTPTARLVPASDPRAKTQRVEDHQRLFGYIMNNPYVQQGPAAPAIMRALTEEGFRIFPDGEKLIPLLPPPGPTGPPPPPPAMPQWAENANFLRGQDHPVNKDDNDEEHMADLMGFLQSPAGQKLDKPGRDMAERHLRGHQAAAIEKKGAALERLKQQQQSLPGPNGGGFGPMAGQPNFQAPNQIPGGGA